MKEMVLGRVLPNLFPERTRFSRIYADAHVSLLAQ